jgi:hypothetical protein
MQDRSPPLIDGLNAPRQVNHSSVAIQELMHTVGALSPSDARGSVGKRRRNWPFQWSRPARNPNPAPRVREAMPTLLNTISILPFECEDAPCGCAIACKPEQPGDAHRSL